MWQQNKKTNNYHCYKKWTKVFIASIALIGICTTTILAMDSNKVVLTVSGEPVYLEEFMLLYNGDKEKTINLAVEAKCKQILAREYGIIEEIDYKSFKKQLVEENKRREATIKKGEVVYGPEQYTEKQYYNYLLSNNIAEVELQIEGEEKDELYGNVEKIYEENKENYKLEDAVTVDVIEVPFVHEDGIVKEDIKAEVKKFIEEIREKIISDEQNLVFTNNDQYKIERKEMTFDYESKIIDENYHPELKENALKLIKINDISHVFEFNGTYNILILRDRYDQGHEPMENVKDQIVVEQIDNKINQKIYELSQKIEINNQVYKDIK